MTELVNEGNIRGHRLEIHAIGDRALDVTLTALENAGVAPEKRPVIAHCQVKQRQNDAFRSPYIYSYHLCHVWTPISLIFRGLQFLTCGA